MRTPDTDHEQRQGQGGATPGAFDGVCGLAEYGDRSMGESGQTRVRVSFLRHPSFEWSRAGGALPVVLLPGGLGCGETVWPALSFLSPRRTTFAIALGALEPRALADAIARILKDGLLCGRTSGHDVLGHRRSDARAHRVGFSMGAQVARLAAIARPEFAASVVLVGAGAPDPRRAERIERGLPLLRLFPAFLWRRRWRRELAAVLEPPTEACSPRGCGVSVKEE